jgi:predicted TIM-barrel enzyme
VLAFYSLGMGEVELRTQHRKKLGSRHPRVGAAVVLWLARAADAEVDAEAILRHAVGIAQIAGRHVGAGVIALDPFDSATESFWRERFGFRASLTRRRDTDGENRPRLWLPLFPDG